MNCWSQVAVEKPYFHKQVVRWKSISIRKVLSPRREIMLNMSTIQNGLTRTDKMTRKRCMGWLPGRLAGTQMWPWSNLPRELVKFFTSGKQQRYFYISRASLPNSGNQKSSTQNSLEWNSLSQHFCSQQNMTPSPCRGIGPVPFCKAAPVLWL